jgi:hypothetical protein
MKSHIKTIIRQKRTQNYTVIPNEMLNNPSLSFKAKAILSYLLSKPDCWSVYLSQLAKASADGYESVVSGMNELIANRYVFRKPCSGANPGGWEYFVYDEPQPEQESPVGDSPIRDFTESGKPVTNKEGLEKVSNEIKEKEKSEKRKPKLADEQFLAQLKEANPRVDFDKEMRKMDNWLLARPGRQKTRAFVTNWINRVVEKLEPEDEWKPTVI